LSYLWSFFAPLPLAYWTIVVGEHRQWADILTRAILGLSLAGFVVGLLWSLWARQQMVVRFLVPLLITHVAAFLVGDVFRSLLTGPKSLLGLLALLYLVAEVVAVLWAMSRLGNTRVAAVLLGWFCILYAALPVLYFADAVGGF
jgi:hypothetical protein